MEVIIDIDKEKCETCGEWHPDNEFSHNEICIYCDLNLFKDEFSEDSQLL